MVVCQESLETISSIQASITVTCHEFDTVLLPTSFNIETCRYFSKSSDIVEVER